MRPIKLRRPSPAFLLASIALFVALGGTGYAASRSGEGGAPAATARKAGGPLTKTKVEKLIAKYVASHQADLRGPAGPAGANGAAGTAGSAGAAGDAGSEGARGPAGPGAIPVALISSSAQSGPQPVATVGPWTITMTCSPNAINALAEIHGPGSIGGTATIATGNAAGATTVKEPVQIGAGHNIGVDTGEQVSATDFLQSGSTLYELKVLLVARNGGLFESCNLVGDAIPVS
jgi:hypothetical protein